MDGDKCAVVVIDDSPTVCKILETTLFRVGYPVKTFLDPVLALRSIFTTGEVPLPELVFVDLIFSGRVDGYQVIRYIRSRNKSLPIIVISRLDGTIDRLRARLAGANHIVTKPFKQQDIVALVEWYAARRQP